MKKTTRINQIAVSWLLGALLVPVMAYCEPDWAGVYHALERHADHSLRGQERAILESRVLMKMRQPGKAHSLLEQQKQTHLVALLKIEAERLSAVEVVRRAGGTADEVHMRLPDDLAPALNRIDDRLDRLTMQLNKNQAKTVAVAKRHPVVMPVVQPSAQSRAVTRADWKELSRTLGQGSSVARRVAPGQRTILRARALMKSGQPEQARQLLLQAPADGVVKLLAIEVERQLSIAAVRRAGGRADEVKMAVPAELDATLVRLDSQLDSLMQHQLIASASQPESLLASPQSAMQRSHTLFAADKAVSEDDRRAVLAAMDAWRLAWSSRDLEAFFASYADDFDTSNRFENLEAWRVYKRHVIGKRSFIQVRAEDIEMNALSDGRIRVEFLQHFRSDAFNADDRKELLFKRSGEQWYIAYEGSMKL